jgi:hypothetical protein
VIAKLRRPTLRVMRAYDKTAARTVPGARPGMEEDTPALGLPSALVLSFSPLDRDLRVRRQLRLLQSSHVVTAAGFTDPELPGIEFVQIRSGPKRLGRRLRAGWRLLTGQHARYYWSVAVVEDAAAALRGRWFDLIVANDAAVWPLADAIRGRAALLCDAHEYSPEQYADRLSWRLLRRRHQIWHCRTVLPTADAVVTVCESIADEYARVFGIPRPEVVLNAPERHSNAPQPTPPDRIRMVHHGCASPTRRAEIMIDLMHHLDERFTLDLMLLESVPGYVGYLKRRAAGHPRIRFRPPVRANDIISATVDYDVGLALLPPTNFNTRCALPNKFFEFVQARLALAIGPSPEMARLVRKHGLGVVADDFTPQALARRLNALDAAAIDGYKAASHRAADELCWETAGRVLQDRVRRLHHHRAPTAAPA